MVKGRDRYDELGSGVRRVNQYLPHYAPGAGKPVFEDGEMFTVTVSIGASALEAEAPVEAPVEPIEVRVLPDEVIVQSFPGPDRSIPMEELKAGRPVGRRYRNRRIGEFLKELELSEGRNTGIPTIQKAMAANGSSLARFETDEERTYLLVRLPLRSAPTPQAAPQAAPQDKLLTVRVLHEMSERMGLPTPQVTPQVAAHVVRILQAASNALNREGLQQAAGLGDRKHFRTIYLNSLIKAGWLAPTIPGKRSSPLQKYVLTEAGRDWLAKHEAQFS